ncbi:SNF2-related protein [Pseudoalteromonas sp. SSDWG2]|uniref:DEAD/DEAH box helicase n=1 Tax=Pseudoalteromonas sp. SSDWG2 TaxID=3139391 RepID=UPI003BA895B5
MSSSFTKEDLLAVFAQFNEQGPDFPLSEQELKALFTKGVYARAQQMLRDEQVLWVKANDAFSHIDAQVMDDDGTTFDQQITITLKQAKPRVEAHCSCNAKIKCKHVASALLHLKLQSQGEYAQHYQLEDWFNELADSQMARPEKDNVLLFELHSHQGQLQVVPKVAPNTPEGLISQGRALTEQQSSAHVTPKGLDEDDFRLFSLVRSQNSPGQSALLGSWGAKVLHQLLNRQRLFFEKSRTPLSISKPLKVEYDWHIEGEKAALTCSLAGLDANCILATAPPYYVDVASNCVYALETPLSAEQIRQLAKFPLVPKDEVETVSRRLRKALGPVIKQPKKKARVKFSLKFLTKQSPFIVSASGEVPSEAALLNMGLEPCKGPLHSNYQLFIDPQNAPRALFELNHAVEYLGGKTVNAPRSALQKVHNGELQLVITALSGHHLLGFFQIVSGAITRPLSVSDLHDAKAYSAQYCFIEHQQGVLIIEAEAAQSACAYLKRYVHDKANVHCTIPRSLFDELQASHFWRVEINSHIEPLLQKPTLDSLKPVVLANDVSLREYQKAGVNWLQLLSMQGLGAVLADDMGLGKTLQVIAYLSTLDAQKQHPHVVICPTSLVGNWVKEFSRFAPRISVQVVAGTNRVDVLQGLSKYQVIVTTYTLFKRDFVFYQGVDFHTVVLDEAQAIKNPQSQLSHKVKQLNARFRLALSGTPFENNLFELKSVFDFAMPSLLFSDRHFKKLYVEQNSQGRKALADVIRPYLLRRAKADVLSELPGKTEIIKQLDMSKEQADVYQHYYQALHNKLNNLVSMQGIGKSKLQFLDALLKLRQICCHPQLVDEHYGASSAKLQWLEEHLPAMLAQDHHVIIFSQFTSMLRIIARQLSTQGIDYALLTGQTRNREQQVDDFQSARKRVFLISLKAGGSGLNLTQADTVIHFDPWWNPAVEHQATDRAHRMGQERSVFVYKLIVANSVEQQVLELADKKRHLVDELLNGSLLSDKKIDDNQLLEMLNLESSEKV